MIGQKQRRAGRLTGSELRLWSVLLALFLAILVPTGCVLWFMSKAMGNERLAVRQKLAEAYRGQLSLVREQLGKTWRERMARIDLIASDVLPAEAFAQVVRGGLSESVILYDENGQVAYPQIVSGAPLEASGQRDGWAEAELLERNGDPRPAAAKYHLLAEGAPTVALKAKALQAETRCWIAADEIERAMEVVETSRPTDVASAADEDGRIVMANVELMLLERVPSNETLRARLAQRLNDYAGATMAASQRRFLMQAFRGLVPDVVFPTAAAEHIAARFLESDRANPRSPALSFTAAPALWQCATVNRRATALFSPEFLSTLLGEIVGEIQAPPGVNLSALPPGSAAEQSGAIATTDAGEPFPGWQLVLSMADPEIFDAAAEKQIAAYLWTAIIVIAAIVLIGLLAARILQHQVHATEVKNDLIATVSHELKTPLSSMRLLVDTLLETEHPDSARVKEYLGLIASENTRLSRLIDNFLAFSRMERNKHAFQFAPTAVERVAHAALGAVQERAGAAACEFIVEIAPDLPAVIGDADALTTALVNLLENACKYSSGEKLITLRTFAREDRICLEVEDKGIGLSPRELKRVFEGFYQVDQRLSRETGGVGLGLSIIRYIVSAHGGDIDVRSEPGVGSVFTIILPAASPAAALTTRT